MLDNPVDGVSDSEYPFHHKSIGLRTVVGLTSALSIVGSLLIALSYLCFKDLRTKVREILMHISFMDLGVGISNLVGVGINFSKYYDMCPDFHDNHNKNGLCINSTKLINNLCLVQGGLALYSTIGSILWTISLSMYLYILISQKGTREARLLVRFAYFFCYLMPIGIVLWQRFTDRVGYSPYQSNGWCGSIFVRPGGSGGEKRDIFASVFSYNLWICLTFVLIPVLSIAAHLYIRDEVKIAGPDAQSDRLLSALQKLDYKFLLVPVAFILLRIWSFIGDIVFVYSGVPRIKPHPLAKTLMYLEGIGDSGQGIANALLFVLFTRRVRERFICCWRHCRLHSEKAKNIKETTGLLNETHPVNSANYSTPEGNFTPSISPRSGSPYS